METKTKTSNMSIFLFLLLYFDIARFVYGFQRFHLRSMRIYSAQLTVVYKMFIDPFYLFFSLFIVWSVYVFNQAYHQKKIIYNKRQVALFAVFFITYVICNLLNFDWHDFESYCALRLRLKLIMFISYVFTMKQFLVLINHKSLMKYIWINALIFSFFMVFIYLFLRGTPRGLDFVNTITNKNWYACLVVFTMFTCLTFYNIKWWIKHVILLSFVLVFALLNARYSFLLASFVLPFLVLEKKWIWFIVLLTSLFIVSLIPIPKEASNTSLIKAIHMTKNKGFSFLIERYKVERLEGTSVMNKKTIMETHNFMVEIYRRFSFWDAILFLYSLYSIFKYKNTKSKRYFWGFLSLIILHGITITSPIYFFVAACGLLLRENEYSEKSCT
jgi:hypothetical protein